jgi:iron complex transport system substrate-binding protein
MKRMKLALVFMAFSVVLAVAAPASAKREFTDMNGIKVTIPVDVKKVYCTSPIGTYLVYCLKPEALLGWNTPVAPETRPFIDPSCADLPALGGTMGGKNTFNTELIIKLAPDIILNFDYKGESNEMVSKLAEQTGIPVVTLHTGLPETPQSTRLLGDVLGVPDRAKVLADYAERTLKEISTAVGSLPEAKRARVYYAESADGLKTDGADSMHAEVLNFLNATNVASVNSAQYGMGMSVSMEQILAWDPAFIVTSANMGGDEFAKKIQSDATWAKVSAVKVKRVFLIPSQPFNWFDRPPSIARILGVQWLGNILYPDLVKRDMKKTTKDFYALFFRVNLTDAQVDSLLDAKAIK